MMMKKLSIVLAILLVAALIFGGVSLSQKNDLQKQMDSKVTDLQKQLDAKVNELATAVSESDAAKAAQTTIEEAKTAAEEAAASLQEQLTALTAEKDSALADAAAKAEETLAALTSEKDAAIAALEEKLSTAATEAETALADAAAKAEEALAAVTGEKETAEKALASANAAVATLQGQVNGMSKLLSGNYAGKTVILHSNDVHGNLEGYAYIATLRNWFYSLGANVILVDAGDFSQGSIYVSSSKGEAAIEMMNAVGYDIATPGNHEFDFGYAQLMENLSKANFTTICANVILDETGASVLPGTAIYETSDGLKIAFLGLETPETATKVHPGLIKEIHFTTFDDLYTCAQTTVDSVKDSADLVIGLWHLGVDEESALNGYRSLDVLAKTTGVDFVLDGHSHTVMTEGPNGEPIQSSGTKFAYVSVVVIDDATKTIEDHYLYPTDGLAQDEAVLAKAHEIMAEVDAKYGAKFATSEVLLTGDKAPGNRTEETNLGDLITDALVWSVVKEGGIEQVEPSHVLGITNGGGIRAAVNVGDVTMKDINTVLPFGNTVAVIYVTGEELLEALEASTFCTPSSIGGYPQTSGITWTLDTTKEYAQGSVYVLDGKESSYFAPAAIQRVTIEAINGEAFDPAATYAVVTNNFCAAGGDTYNAFARAYSEGSGFDTGIPMDEAVMAYITEVLNGVITAEAYGAPRGSETQIK